MKGWKKLSAAVALAVAWGSASAAASEQEAARLGKDLTPVGAEKAGNKEGTIPAWTGGITKAPASGYWLMSSGRRCRFIQRGSWRMASSAASCPCSSSVISVSKRLRQPKSRLTASTSASRLSTSRRCSARRSARRSARPGLRFFAKAARCAAKHSRSAAGSCAARSTAGVMVLMAGWSGFVGWCRALRGRRSGRPSSAPDAAGGETAKR